jgi:RNase P/RNase MRP subunit p29
MSTRNNRNKFDKKDSLDLGQKAEDRFASFAQKKGWAITEASKEGNIEDHYDYEISKDDRHYRVDVKSKKRVSRKTGKVQEELIWIEFRTVRDTKGWLFGNADLIAFEQQNGFKIVERKALVRVINKLVKIHVKVSKPEDALYKVYTRKRRPDEIALIKVSDLDSILWDEWEPQTTPG